MATMRKFKVRIITYVLKSENECLQIIGLLPSGVELIITVNRLGLLTSRRKR